MQIDRNFVTREFKHFIWPLCKVYGFSKISGRTMWRFREGATDVINLQGDRWNTLGEPQRFFINLGVYLTGIERSWVRQERGRALPSEGDCDLRGALRRTMLGGRTDVGWAIAPDGSDVEEVMRSLQAAFEDDGFPWFRRFWEPDQILHYMMETERGNNEIGLGRLGSPSRTRMIGLYALSLGRHDLAERYLVEYEKCCSAGEIDDLVVAGLVRVRDALMERDS